MQSWYWFRVRYEGGITETVATLDTSLQTAYSRQRESARARARYWRENPKRGWKLPRQVIAIDVIREPDNAIRDAYLKKYLDIALRLANNSE